MIRIALILAVFAAVAGCAAPITDYAFSFDASAGGHHPIVKKEIRP